MTGNDQGQVRPASDDDLEAVEICVQSAYAHYESSIGIRPAPMDDDYSKAIGQGHVLVYVVDTSVVAVCVRHAGGDHIVLENLAVMPACQGLGLGRKLLQFVSDEASAMGISKIRLYTNALMTKNIEVYQHMGFVVTERKLEDGFDRIHMELSLAGYRRSS